MFARHLSVKSTPENRSSVEAIADEVFGHLKTLDGFVSVHFMVSQDGTEYGSLSLWETREQAESGGAQIQSRVKDKIAAIATEPPVINTYEVYKPKS